VLDMLDVSVVILLGNGGRVGLSVLDLVVEVTMSILERSSAE
jgi:hypothetical protein